MKKTKYLEFRNKSKDKTECTLYLGEQILDGCNLYKYLGIYFDEHLTFEKNADTCQNQHPEP